MLKLNPSYMDAYVQFSSHPWRTRTLDPKVRELIYITIDSSATHLYEIGARAHIKNAIKYGVTIGEIFEVYALASVIGIHSYTVSLPVLLEEIRNREG